MTGNIRYRLARRPLRVAILATNTDSSAFMRSDTPESRFPLFHAIRLTSALSTLSTSSTSTFSTLLRPLSRIQRLTNLSVWRASCLTARVRTQCAREGALCHWFSYSSAGGTSGTAFCGIARGSGCWTRCAMAFGWRIADRKVLS
jgi:hypothetical protein